MGVVRYRRNALACGIPLVAGLCLAACGGPGSDGVIVRIGSVTITKAALDHRMSVVALGRAASDRGATRQQALDRLISSQWLIGEAAEEGHPVTKQELDGRLKEKQRSTFPGGEAELDEFLKQAGQTVSDVAREAEVELASERLRHAIVESVSPVTDAELARYYRQHRARFGVPELREVRITNRKTWAKAERVRKEVEAGVVFATISEIEKAAGPRGVGGQRREPSDSLERAIYSATPHQLIGPVKYNVDYFVFELKKVVAPYYQPLAQVRDSLKRQLTGEARRRALVEFLAAWRRRWRAKTHCQVGYVVSNCAQYMGAETPEDTLTLG